MLGYWDQHVTWRYRNLVGPLETAGPQKKKKKKVYELGAMLQIMLYNAVQYANISRKNSAHARIQLMLG